MARSFLGKLKRGLFMTHTEFLDRLDAAVEGRGVVDEETLEHLEETLIGTDVGVETALELIDSVICGNDVDLTVSGAPEPRLDDTEICAR